MNINLNNLDDDEFLDEVGEHLGWDDPDWASFCDGDVIRRTGEALEVMEVRVMQQLTAREGDESTENQAWRRKAKNFHSLVSLHLRQVRRRIHEIDAREQSNARHWKAFAHSLVDILDDSDMSDTLDDIIIPIGGLTARQWRDRRVEKRAHTNVVHLPDFDVEGLEVAA